MNNRLNAVVDYRYKYDNNFDLINASLVQTKNKGIKFIMKVHRN